jgi:hypothetical protein
MDQHQEQTDCDPATELPSDGPSTGNSVEAHSRTGTTAFRGVARTRPAVAVLAAAALIVSGIGGLTWFWWTRTDRYQLQRVEAEAPDLLAKLAGADATYRWIAVLALANSGSEATITASAMADPYDRLQALSRVTAILAVAGESDDAERAGRELVEVARVLVESASRVQDPLKRIASLKRVALALADAGRAEPARAVATRIGEASLEIADPQARFTTFGELSAEFARSGHRDLSIAVLEQIDDPEQRLKATAAATAAPAARSHPTSAGTPSDQLGIARDLARQHRFREARARAEACNQLSDRLDAFTAIVCEALKMKKPQLTAILDTLEGRSELLPKGPAQK